MPPRPQRPAPSGDPVASAPSAPEGPRFRFSIPFSPSRKHANVVFAIVDPDLDVVNFRPGDYLLSFDLDAKVLTVMGRGEGHARPHAKGAPIVPVRGDREGSGG